MAKAYRKNGTLVAKARSVAAQRGADNDAIFILSKPVRYPKQKTDCSDLPKQRKQLPTASANQPSLA